MNSPMMRTKISVPRRRNDTFRRERLVNQLKTCLEYKLLMVSAPAGSGKTTTIVDFLSEVKIPACWYSLDEYDIDPYRFLSHFIGCISVQFTDFGKDSMDLLHQMNKGEINIESMVSIVINDIYDHIFEHFIIVLDDFHLVEEHEDVVTFISRFLEYVDENCHLFILSRTLTGLPNLPLMVARNQVSGLSFDELIFQENEIFGLFQQNFRVELTKSQLIEIQRNSEGWITGLLLTASQNDSIGQGGWHSYKTTGIGIDAYLGQQIIQKQPDSIQQFLYHTSLLEEFDASLCRKVIDKVLGTRTNWELLMESALQKNLFLTAVQDSISGNVSLRFHHLFRDFLQKQIFIKEPETAHAIRSQLASVLTEEKDWDRAISIHLSLGDKDSAEEVLEIAGPEMLSEGRYDGVAGWLDQLKGEIRNKYPVLMSLQGAISVMKGDVLLGINALSESIEIFRNQKNNLFLLNQALSRRATAYRFIGDFENCQNDINEVVKFAKDTPESHILLSNVYREEAHLAFRKGDFQSALEKILKADAIYNTYGESELRAGIAIDIGSIQRAIGLYEDAEKTYQQAIDYFQKIGNHKTLANLYNNLGVLLHTLGKYSQAVFSFEQTINHAKIGDYPRFEAFGLVGIADLYNDIEAFPESQEAYNNALTIIRSTKDHPLLIYVLTGFCQMFIKQKQFREYEKTLHEILCLKTTDLIMAANLKLIEVEYLYACEEYSNAMNKAQEFIDQFGNSIEKFELAKGNYLLLLCNYHLGLTDQVINILSNIEQNIVSRVENYTYLRAGKHFSQDLEKITFSNKRENQKLNWIINQITNFGEPISQVRKRIRQHLSDLPLPPANYKITALGKAIAKIDKHEITNQEWQSLKALELLILIINNELGYFKDQICDLLWPDGHPNDLPLRFKNTLYRLRRVVGKDAIILLNNRYLFNRSLDYEYDVESFENQLVEADRIGDEKSRIRLYKSSIRLYKGPFLANEDAPWITIERERLHYLYRNAIVNLSELLISNKKFNDVIELVRPLLETDGEFEEAYRLLMRSFSGIGDPKGVIEYFNKCKQVLNENLGISPNQETLELKKRLIN